MLPSSVTISQWQTRTGKIAVNEKCDKFKMIVGRLALVACQCCTQNCDDDEEREGRRIEQKEDEKKINASTSCYYKLKYTI